MNKSHFKFNSDLKYIQFIHHYNIGCINITLFLTDSISHTTLPCNWIGKISTWKIDSNLLIIKL